MAFTSTVFVRVVSQDRGRGFVLLVGFDPKIVQSNAVQMITLSVPTRSSLNATIDRVKASYSASEIRDVTADGIQRLLRKEFGEPQPLSAKKLAVQQAKENETNLESD